MEGAPLAFYPALLLFNLLAIEPTICDTPVWAGNLSKSLMFNQ